MGCGQSNAAQPKATPYVQAAPVMLLSDIRDRQLAPKRHAVKTCSLKEGLTRPEKKQVLHAKHQRLLADAGATYADLRSNGFRKGDVLIIVDMQNDFLPTEDAPDGGRLGVPEGAGAAATIVDLTKRAAAAGALIVATRDYHPKNHCSFNTQSGPFPPHCVQGSKGSKFCEPIEKVLNKVRGDGADVRVVFKGFAPEVDSFGGLPYEETYFRDRQLGNNLCTEPSMQCHGCCAVDWTGGFTLECSSIDEDVNAPPDVMAVLSRKSLAQQLSDENVRRIFVCGLALDFCVLDTALNAASQRLAQEEGVFLVADAARAVYAPGVGQFGSGFVSSPSEIVKKINAAGVHMVLSTGIGK
jgi:nicotinamidase-related amidase